jgi:hypothetical protein
MDVLFGFGYDAVRVCLLQLDRQAERGGAQHAVLGLRHTMQAVTERWCCAGMLSVLRATCSAASSNTALIHEDAQSMLAEVATCYMLRACGDRQHVVDILTGCPARNCQQSVCKRRPADLDLLRADDDVQQQLARKLCSSSSTIVSSIRFSACAGKCRHRWCGPCVGQLSQVAVRAVASAGNAGHVSVRHAGPATASMHVSVEGPTLTQPEVNQTKAQNKKAQNQKNTKPRSHPT